MKGGKKKNVKDAPVEGYSYLVESEGWSDEELWSWQFDHELQCEDIVETFNTQNPVKLGNVRKGTAALAQPTPADKREAYVKAKIEEWLTANPGKTRGGLPGKLA